MNSIKDIYFYDALALAKELRNGTFTEYRAIKQLIASVILSGIGFSIPITVTFTESNIGIIRTAFYIATFILSGVISYYGIWLTYQVNNKGDSKDYFLRHMSLALPIGIQLMILFLGILVLILFLSISLTSQLGEVGAYLTQTAFFIATLAFVAMYFIRMRKYMAIASGANDQIV